MLVGFAGVETREEAAALMNGELLADSERLPDAGPGMADQFQRLWGCERQHGEGGGGAGGKLADIIPPGARGVSVGRGERELLIPATPEVLRRVDLEGGTITVKLP